MKNFSDNLTGENVDTEPNTRYLTASTLIGDKVYNNLNEDLGEVKEIMLNLKNGTIEYVVIEFGGFLGIGEKFFAVPFRALTLDHTRHAFILGQRREVLENAPGFDKNHWPETNSSSMRSTSDYWTNVLEPTSEADLKRS